jgi:hypothetical protein
MYLRCVVQSDAKHWKSWLRRAKFWYNSTHHTSLGCSPFKALYGHDPNTGLVPQVTATTSMTVTEMVEELQAQHIMLKEQLAKA